jgi:DMSO/TMAO reductase YedYZ molybdopterin-dependent catalytic subunit
LLIAVAEVAMPMLTIEGEGLVRRFLELPDLIALPGQLAHRSELFGGREVAGVSLSSVLRLIEPRASARYIRFSSADGYSTTIALAALGDAQLVYRLGDEPLPAKLGGPVRLVVSAPTPRSCLKFVTTLALTAEPSQERLPECDHHKTRAA